MPDQTPADRPSRVTRPRATTSVRPRRPPQLTGADTAAIPAADLVPGTTGGEPDAVASPTAPAPMASAVEATAPVTADTAPSPASSPPRPSERLEVRWGSLGRSDADEVAVTFGGVGLARARDVSVELGALGLGLGERVRVERSMASAVIGGAVELEQSFSRVVVGARVTFRRASGALFVLAGRVDGDVRTLVDWRGALAFGLAAGVAVGLLRRRPG